MDRKVLAEDRRRIPLTGLALALLLVSCRPASQPVAVRFTPTPTPKPQPISLPADDLPHHVLTEWWYYTGHLKGREGRAYGFEFVIFQSQRRDSIAYAAHLAVTDHRRNRFRFYEGASFGSQLNKGSLDLTVGPWRLSGTMGKYSITAAAEGYKLELSTQPLKPPAFHMGGLIDFGPAGSSYYYSFTRLSVTGTMVDASEPVPVVGTGWMDHQWGNFIPLADGGWDWFALQLDNGDDIMIYILRNASDNPVGAYATHVDPQGSTRSLDPRKLQVAPLSKWTSPRTGTVYPMGWLVNLEELGLRLQLQPVMPDQELDARRTTGVIYWEGEVVVEGLKGTLPVRGEGYVELTGYAK
jgi:predicted secreted hydrolase